MRDRNFRMLVSFTLIYGVFALAMLAAQPHTPAGLRTAEAGGKGDPEPISSHKSRGPVGL